MMTFFNSVRPAIVVSALICAGPSTSVQAQVPSCAPLQVDAETGALIEPVSDAGRQQRWYLESGVVEPGAYLLGLDGQRIEVGRSLMPSSRLVDGRMQVQPPWPQAVDWSVYHQPASALRPGLALVFHSDDKGQQHLCRLELRILSDRYFDRVKVGLSERQQLMLDSMNPNDPLPDWLKPPQASELEVFEIEQLVYDDQGRVRGSERLNKKEDGSRWEAKEAQCITYDKHGIVSTVGRHASGRCVDARPDDALSRHVHGGDGRLLRTIEKDIRMEVQGGEYQLVAHPMVLVYDGAGEIKARYREDAASQVYRLPETSLLDKHGRLDVSVVESMAGLAKLVISDPESAPSMEWRITAVPKDAEDLYGLYDDELSLAKGRIGKQGKVILTAEQRAKIWQAMNSDDQLVILHWTERLVLAPGVSTKQWQACLSQDQATAEACP